jgi:carbamoyl-phosphate synthase large subunit
MAGLEPVEIEDAELESRLGELYSDRLWTVAEAFRRGYSAERVFERTKIDPWFLHHIQSIVKEEDEIRSGSFDLRRAKRNGFSDARIAALSGRSEDEVRAERHAAGLRPVFKRVDTCGAEFEAHTPYLYSTYEEECEAEPTDRPKVIILGGGPNRIGQGIEFDYCCVHAVMGLEKDGYETIMVNCNPETVSTDYDTSDRLYFEPLTLEDVLEIVAVEKPVGVIVQFGGQTPLKLAVPLERAGVPILGTPPDAIDRAEDRERFAQMLNRLGLRQPENGTARSVDAACRLAEDIGYPVLVRPSYVLGGRAMQIVHDRASLETYMREAVTVSPEHPVLVDRFLPNAIEVDVDAICDGEIAVIAGIMEHIEEAGVHSGDSACSLPPYSLPRYILDEIRRATAAMALELGVRGLMNVQYAVVNDEVYVIEVNPRASRTVPFVAKAIGRPVAQLAARVMAGKSLAELGFTSELEPSHVSVKEAVFPFVKFPGVDTLLGPEMKSTGEVMGIDQEFGRAYAKAQRAAGMDLPVSGRVLVSVREEDKAGIVEPVRVLQNAGFEVAATNGTAHYLKGYGIDATRVNKVSAGSPHTEELVRSGDVQLVMVTTRAGDAAAVHDSAAMRRAALELGVPYFTTLSGARAAASAIRALRDRAIQPVALQDLHG